MEKCDQEDWSVSDKSGVFTTCSATYHLEVGWLVSLKVATKASLRSKKNCIGRFSTAYVRFQEEDWIVSDKFGITTPCSSTYHLEVWCTRFIESSYQSLFKS